MKYLYLLIFILMVSVLAGCQSFQQSSQKEASLESSIKRWKTDVGADVWFYQNPNLPMVDIELTFDAGSLNDGDKLGLANLTNELIGESAHGKNAQQISEVFEQQGAIFSKSVVKTRAKLGLRSLTGEPLAIALGQFGEILSASEFKQTDFDRVIQQLDTYLKYLANDASYQEGKLMDSILFKGHALANPILGDFSSIELLTVEDVRAFWTAFYCDGNVDIAITGDVSLVKAKQIAATLIEQLNDDCKPIRMYEEQLATANYEVGSWLPFNTQQAQIQFAQLTIGRQHQDYVALKIASQVLGGGSSSRLYKSIREDKGLSYGVSSYFSSVLDKGEFGISLQTEAMQSQEAVDAVNSVIENWHEHGISEQELKRAKAKFNLGLAQYLTQNKGINNYLSMMAYEGLPADYLDRFFERIDALTVDSVNQAIQQHIDLQNWKLIVLGAEKE